MKQSEIVKMLRAIINGQSSLKQELKAEIKKLDQKLSNKIDQNRVEIKKNTKRLDKLGKQLAYLEDDAPTRGEHDELEKRVSKLERQVVL